MHGGRDYPARKDAWGAGFGTMAIGNVKPFATSPRQNLEAGITAGGNGNWKADADDMNCYPYKHHFQGERVFAGVGERQHNAVHEEVNRRAVKDSSNDRVLNEKRQKAADQDKCSRGGKGDQEVASETENCCGKPAVE